MTGENVEEAFMEVAKNITEMVEKGEHIIMNIFALIKYFFAFI